ncbi:hypothetical protein GCM10023321_37790 [Pseudonocardia eucalypti]|uniref:CopG family transcriptional regulator n=1 Tax=Pseudonocardia eucalypti TaxID=648755 RepID=A0ABP9QBB4_9PSEU|nr:putative transcriptional regulator [Pseudonocardia eucalypti]
MKTTAVRLEDELYAQLTIVAQLEGQTVTDIIRLAVIGYIEQRKTSLSSQADAALAEIEREAAIRRQAITALFGNGDSAAPEVPAEADTTSTGRNRRGKDGGASSS